MARRLPRVLKLGAEVAERFAIRRGLAFGGNGYYNVSSSFGFAGRAIEPLQPAQQPLDTVPTLEQPKRVYSRSNPTVLTLVKQLEDLGRLASSIGLLTKKQQELLLGQLKESNKVARENNLEAKRPQKVDGLSADNLRPLTDVVSKLASTLGLLTDTVEDKQQQIQSYQPGFLDNFFNRRGYGMYYSDWRMDRQAKKAAKKEAKRYAKTMEGRMSKFDSSDFLDKNGKPLNRSQVPMRLRKLENVAKSKTLSGRFTNAIKSSGSMLTRAVGSTTIAKSLTKAIEKGTAKAAVKSTAVRSTVQKLAGPLITKALGSTALKSIPVIGAVAGLGFAASRLVEGDVVGAGLEAASGLGGPLTAIPALIASIARDIYSDVYGVKPEQDSNFSGRIDDITKSVKEMVLDYIKPKVTTKNTPTQAKVDQKLTAKKPESKSNDKVSLTTPSSPIVAPTSTGIGGAVDAAVGTFNNVGKMSSGQQSSPTPVSPKPTATMEPKAHTDSSPTTGASLIAAQKKQDQPNIGVMDLGGKPATKSTTPTSKSNAKGVGNVPDPNYYHDLGSQLYFSFYAGANV